MLNRSKPRQISFSGTLLFLSLSLHSFAQSAASGTAPQTEENQYSEPENASQSGSAAVHYSERVIKDQLAHLEQTIPLRYTAAVQRQIRSYTTLKKRTLQAVLARQDRYFPLFESVLTQHGLPQELKYLPVVESTLNPVAVSPAKAAGLWQLMPLTARSFGLAQDMYVDERLDAEKATTVACRYLGQLYRLFDNWELALAAYNAGPGRVRRAIRRAGNRTSLQAIAPHLPVETRQYVPAFVAVTYMMNHHAAYQIHPDTAATLSPVDTLQLDQPVDLALLAVQLRVPLSELRRLNPCFKSNLVPAYFQTYTLMVPRQAEPLTSPDREAMLTAARPKLTPARQSQLVQFYGATRQKKVIHQVQTGEDLAQIAVRYGILLSQLQEWNQLAAQRLSAGQKVVIYRDKCASPLTSTNRPAVAKVEKILPRLIQTKRVDQPLLPIVSAAMQLVNEWALQRTE